MTTKTQQALDDLTVEYQNKAKREGFAHLGDATEALAATRDYALRSWLHDFILRWDATEALDKYPETSEAAIYQAALIAVLGTPRNASIDATRDIARKALQRVAKLQNGTVAA